MANVGDVDVDEQAILLLLEQGREVEYLETMEDDDLAGLALRYLDLEQERTTLVDAVLDSDLQDKRRIASLLQDAGIFSTMGRRNTEL